MVTPLFWAVEERTNYPHPNMKNIFIHHSEFAAIYNGMEGSLFFSAVSNVWVFGRTDGRCWEDVPINPNDCTIIFQMAGYEEI